MRIPTLTIGCVLALALSLGAEAQPAPRFDETLAKIAVYEIGDNEAPLADLDRLVGAGSSSPDEVKRMEQAFLKALGGGTTLAGKDLICRRLSLVGSAASVPALTALLGAPETSDMARYALERIPGAAVNEAMRTMLPKALGKRRIGIVNTLGQRGDAASISALAGLIAGNDADAAIAAVAALGRIGDSAAASTLTAARPKSSGALRHALDEAWMSCAEHMERRAAFAVYKALLDAAEPESIRIAAMRGLGLTGGKDAVPLLAAVLKTGEPRMQAEAIRPLSAVPGTEASAALRQAFGEVDTLGKVRVLEAVADRGGPNALPLVRSAAQDTIQPVRAAALLALGKIGDSSAVMFLAETAAHGASQAPAPDADAVRTGGFPDERNLQPSGGLTDGAAARDSLYSLRGAEIDRAILAGIAPAPPKVKVELIAAAAERGLRSANAMLLQCVADNDRDVRRAALRALRATAAPTDAPALLDLLAKASATDRPDLARVVSAALKQSDTASVAPVIAAWQTVSDAGLRGSLLGILAQLGRDESLPVLRGALKDPSVEIRRAAVLALSNWPNTKPMADLLEVAGGDANAALQVLSLQGYIRLIGIPDNRPPAETVRMLSDAIHRAQRAEEKKAALAILQRINTPEALAVAEDAIRDQDVSDEAKAAADRIRQRFRP
jgi:HEAT repeat protein